MKNVPDHELLSAYLDGELTAAEQARVEQLLAADPSARQVLDDLRSLSSTLQGLPQQKLDEDLSQRVLRAVERRMLARPDNRPAPTPADRPLWQEIHWRGMLGRRALAWSGMAVAIAAMLAWNEWRQPNPAENREIAVAPSGPRFEVEDARDQLAPARAPSAAAGDEKPLAPALVPGPARDLPAGNEPKKLAKAEAAAPADRSDRPRGTGSSESGKLSYDKEKELTESTARSSDAAYPREVPAPATLAPPEKSQGAAGRLAMKSPVAGRGPAAPAAPAVAPAESAPQLAPAPVVAAEKAYIARDDLRERNGRGQMKTAEENSKRLVGRAFTPDASPNPAPAAGERESDVALTPGTSPPAGAGSKPSEAEGESPLADAETDGVMVVQCDISLDAARKHAFDQVLADNGISWKTDAKHRAKSDGAEGDLLYRQEGQPEDKKEKDAGGWAEGKHDLSLEKPAKSQAPALDLVLVEARPEQVEQVLKQLAARPGEFPAVAVRPVPGMEEQKDFDQFSRNGTAVLKRSGVDRGGRADFKSALRESEKARAMKKGDGRADLKSALQEPEKAASEVKGAIEKGGQAGSAVPADGYARRIPVPGYSYGGDKDLRRTPVMSGPAGPGSGGGATADPRARSGLSMQASAAAPAAHGEPKPASAKPKSRIQTHRKENTDAPAKDESGAKQSAAPAYRVLFVLRVVGRETPAAATILDHASQIDAAKESAKPAAEPPPAQTMPSSK